MDKVKDEEDFLVNGNGHSNGNSSSSRNNNWRSYFGLLGVLGCLTIIGLLAGVLVVLIQIRDDNNNTSTGDFGYSNQESAGSNSDAGNGKTPTTSSASTSREFIGSLAETERICGGKQNVVTRMTVETARNMYLWNVTVRESVCCSDWTDAECHMLGLKCSDCSSYDGNLATTGKCDSGNTASTLQAPGECMKLKTRSLEDLLNECQTSGGTVQAVYENIIHRHSDYVNPKEQNGLVAKCVQATEDRDSEVTTDIGVVCGSCESSDWGVSNYVEREDCRALNPTYPSCATNGEADKLGAPMVTSDHINDLLSLCSADEVSFHATRVHPRKYGDGNEIELNAFCDTIGDFSMLPKFGVVCGHCENETFMPSGLCNGVDPELLQSEAKCSTNVVTELKCSQDSGTSSQMGFVGEYGGNLTRAVLLCCTNDCQSDLELSGLFCGECVGPGWKTYAPYRNCSDFLYEPYCS